MKTALRIVFFILIEVVFSLRKASCASRSISPENIVTYLPSATTEMQKSQSVSSSKIDNSVLSDVGLYGLAIMGQNFALNMAENGLRVSVSNRSPAKVDATVQRSIADGNLPICGFTDPKSFVESIKKPRKIIILVQAGNAVDETIKTLSEYMESGDIIVDGGNEWFPNSIRRADSLKAKGIHFIGMGISGGEEGARKGPSLMPGGPKEAYDLIEPLLTRCAAEVEDGTCLAYLGPIGAGNYVKMVHNGIEYGDMQLIAEIYDVLKNLAGLDNEQIAKILEEWNQGELSSFLIEITAKILSKKDDLTNDGSFLVDKILDKTGMKGTGRWTVQEAAERSVAVPTIAAALEMRYLSSRKEERLAASTQLKGPDEIPEVETEQIIEDCRQALYAAKVCSYAQGMCLIKAASDQLGWNIDLSECARIWKGGCIIRAQLLGRLQAAYKQNPRLPNLLIDPSFASDLGWRQNAWRRIITLSIASGISVPALAASLSYYDTYRRATLPAGLTQAQRDYFGGHTFERFDRPGLFHAQWTEAHKDIGNLAERTAGNL